MNGIVLTLVRPDLKSCLGKSCIYGGGGGAPGGIRGLNSNLQTFAFLVSCHKHYYEKDCRREKK